MGSSSTDENPAAYYGFNDTAGFKDFLVYVLSYAPDLFPKRDWRSPDKQMNLERAFVGLRYGLTLFPAEELRGDFVSKCRDLIERAYVEYCSGRDMDGQRLLEEAERMLQRR